MRSVLAAAGATGSPLLAATAPAAAAASRYSRRNNVHEKAI